MARLSDGGVTNRAASTAPLTGGVSYSAPSGGGFSGGATRSVPPAVVAPVQNTNPVQVTTVTNDPTYNQPLYYTETNNIESPFKGMSLRGNAPSMDIPSFNFSPLNPLTDPSMGVLPSAHQASLIQNVGGGGSNDNFMKAFALADGGQILPPQVAPPIQQQRRTQDPDGLQAQTPSMDVPPVAPQRQQAPPPYMPPPVQQRPMPQPAPQPQPGPWMQQAQDMMTPSGRLYPAMPNFNYYLPQPAPPKQGLAGIYDKFVHQPAQRFAEAASPQVAYAHAAQRAADNKLRLELFKEDSANYRQIQDDANERQLERMKGAVDLAKEEMKGDVEMRKADLTAKAQGKMTQAQGWALFQQAQSMDVSTPDQIQAKAQALQQAGEATGQNFMSHLMSRDPDAIKAAAKKELEATKDAYEIAQKKFDLTNKAPREVNAMDRTAAIQNNEIKMMPVKNAQQIAGMQTDVANAALNTNPNVLAARATQAVNAGIQSGQQIQNTGLDMAAKQADMAGKPISMGLQAFQAGNMAMDPNIQKQMYQLGANLTGQGQRGYDAVRRFQQAPGAQQGFVPPPPPLVPAMDPQGNIDPDMYMMNGKPVPAAEAAAMTGSQTGFPRGSLLQNYQQPQPQVAAQPQAVPQRGPIEQFAEWMQTPPPMSLAPPRPGAVLNNLAVRDGYLQAANGNRKKAKKMAEDDGWTLPKLTQAAIQALTAPPPATLAPPGSY